MLVAKKWIKMPSLLVEQYNQKDTLPRDLYLHGLLNNEQLRIKKKVITAIKGEVHGDKHWADVIKIW